MEVIKKIAKMRQELKGTFSKQGEVNSKVKFKYFTLKDIFPSVMTLSEKYNVFLEFSTEQLENPLVFNDGNKSMSTNVIAKLTVINLDDIKDTYTLSLPFLVGAMMGCTSPQFIGSASTYTEKYLYFKMFNIEELDNIEEMTAKRHYCVDCKSEIKAVKTKDGIKSAEFVVDKLLQQSPDGKLHCKKCLTEQVDNEE